MPKLTSKEFAEEIPVSLRVFMFHGVELHWRKGDKDALGNCPFCDAQDKFAVRLDAELWKCPVCNVKGNQYDFIRSFYVACSKVTTDLDYEHLREDRGLLSEDTLVEWGLRKSVTTGRWLVPGYNHEGKMIQLYQYTYNGKRNYWMATPTMGHGLLGYGLFDPKKKTNIICEGLWDGTALWEILGKAKPSTEEGRNGYVPTGSEASSMLADKNVLAIATANAFKESYVELFKDSTVILMGQNDHAKLNEKTGQVIPPTSHTEMGKVCRLLIRSAKDMSYLTWEEGGCVNGFTTSLPSGYDVRDYLTEGYNPEMGSLKALGLRLQRLQGLEVLIRGLPEAFVTDDPSTSGDDEENKGLKPLDCPDYKTLITSWRKALRWRQSLDDVLSTMLAVAASTQQVGDQLFLQVVGQASGGKTKLCDAMLVSKQCFALEHLTGFYSGTVREDGQDCSLIARMNGKTIITPEGDVIMSSPNFISIMSEQRRIFDGTGGHTFKTDIKDKKYAGLRTPWIMAGTPAMMDTDQSRLGDRFLKVFLDEPGNDEKRSILNRCGHDALMSVMMTSNGEPDKQLNPKQVEAYRLTGGYVDYLRANAERLLNSLAVNIDGDELVSYCSFLGEFTADLRARPDPEAHKKDLQACKEMGTRLTSQFVRLACCLAVVLNKDEIDREVLRRVKKVALDTARGTTLEIVKFIRKEERAGRKGVEVKTLSSHINKGDEKTRVILRFMRDIEILKYVEPPKVNGVSQKPRWHLSDRMQGVYIKVMEQ